ncbi:MAG: hypothetical protein M1839_006029 [Geoglossum umbratile]|nr:MAG: hypothetical protein M1839_006029 [Geoglossum umbratile]
MNELTSIGGLKRFYSAIPRTIRDTMELCRLLNERYLWVDSRCLIQDDPSDTVVGIQSMNLIYEQSLLNTVAGSGQGAEAGLLGIVVLAVLLLVVKQEQSRIETGGLAGNIAHSATTPLSLRSDDKELSAVVRRIL